MKVRVPVEAVIEWGDNADVRIMLYHRLSHLENAKVLEVGCGRDYLLGALPESSKGYGIDVDGDKLKIARKNVPNASFKKASMYGMPFKKDFFDVVVCANALPGVDFPLKGSKTQQKALRLKTLKEFKRVLKKHGVLLLTTPNGGYGNWPGKISYDELHELLEKAGFKFGITGWNPFPPYIPPSRVLVKIPGWFRLLNKLAKKKIAVRKSKFFYVEAAKR